MNEEDLAMIMHVLVISQTSSEIQIVSNAIAANEVDLFDLHLDRGPRAYLIKRLTMRLENGIEKIAKEASKRKSSDDGTFIGYIIEKVNAWIEFYMASTVATSLLL